jgi:hypothetical protein
MALAWATPFSITWPLTLEKSGIWIVTDSVTVINTSSRMWISTRAC